MTLPRRSLSAMAVSITMVGSIGVAGCSVSRGSDGAPTPDNGSPSARSSPTSAATVKVNVRQGADSVKVDKVVTVTASQGTLSDVTMRTRKGRTIKGALTDDKTVWTAKERLEPNTGYRVRATAADSAGLETSATTKFRSADLSLDQQTYASVSPLEGQVVGVGFPIMVRFDVPVKRRAEFERNMHVISSAGQKGRWHWIDSQTVHYRPRHYWKPGSRIKVDLKLNSLAAGNGIYGQEDRKFRFRIGRSVIARVNTVSDQMSVFIDGKRARTIPITTGQQPKYTTRSGIKVIIEKYRAKRMNSETVGIDPNSPDGYNIDNVEYAQRVTFSGEFIHAAPWSVGSQGRANVSHGCTGMSTTNAGWFYAQTKPGDVVVYSGTSKPMTLTNGYGDWNLNWADWVAGSAL